jgi:hypothetical protein
VTQDHLLLCQHGTFELRQPQILLVQFHLQISTPSDTPQKVPLHGILVLFEEHGPRRNIIGIEREIWLKSLFREEFQPIDNGMNVNMRGIIEIIRRRGEQDVPGIVINLGILTIHPPFLNPTL